MSKYSTPLGRRLLAAIIAAILGVFGGKEILDAVRIPVDNHSSTLAQADETEAR